MKDQYRADNNGVNSSPVKPELPSCPVKVLIIYLTHLYKERERELLPEDYTFPWSIFGQKAYGQERMGFCCNGSN
ncbi:Casein Kinase I Isoform Alpha-Like [Manis pentadactyla]|nr:Casein Kinase I Isoform Alpha-Like [Manis pentadactyla]